MPGVGHDFTAVLSAEEPSDSKPSSPKMERVVIFVRTDDMENIIYSVFVFKNNLLFRTTKVIVEYVTQMHRSRFPCKELTCRYSLAWHCDEDEVNDETLQ